MNFRVTLQMWGVGAVLLSCCLSGFSGVYFEYLLKKKATDGSREVSLWMRNIQLGAFSIPLNALNVWLFVEWDSLMDPDRGLFRGFCFIVCFVVFLQASSGLIVASVIKFADSILKNFATSASLMLSTLLSMALAEGLQSGCGIFYWCRLCFGCDISL